MAEDIPGDARLLTYAELGELLGIEPESAKRRAVRHGWRRVPGNEGRTLVAVPRTALPEHPPVPRTSAATSEDSPRDVLRDAPQDNPEDRQGDKDLLSLALDDLRTALRSAEQRLADIEGRAGRAEARAEAAQKLADRRGEELAETRERAGRAEGEATALRAAAIEVQAARTRIEGEAAALREQATTERARAETKARELEAMRADLADWTAGGPLARAWRALVYRRGRP